MKNPNILHSRNKQYQFKRILKKKVFFSNELKNALYIAFNEAKNCKIYVTPELILYGLIKQSNSIAAKLLITTISQFQNNKNLSPNIISDKIREVNRQSFNTKLNTKESVAAEFSPSLWNENLKTPWLTPEVKELLKSSLQSSLKTNKKVIILDTKQVFFDLLNKETVYNFLRQLLS